MTTATIAERSPDAIAQSIRSCPECAPEAWTLCNAHGADALHLPPATWFAVADLLSHPLTQ